MGKRMTAERLKLFERYIKNNTHEAEELLQALKEERKAHDCWKDMSEELAHIADERRETIQRIEAISKQVRDDFSRGGMPMGAQVVLDYIESALEQP